MEEINRITEYFPEGIRNEINKLLLKYDDLYEQIEEIRIRNNKPIIIKAQNDSKILKYIVSEKEILEIFEKICENSIYSYRKQICEGFITIKGGHRIGITGNVVMEEQKIVNITYISSLNFRIAREKIDCSDNLLKYVINMPKNNIYNTLIISPPGCGKTTILRDLIRKISNGIKQIEFKGKTVGVVDERGEIAAMYKGVPQNDIGVRTDVMDNISKSKGMKMLIRSMSPEIITCDEIGNQEDIEAINYAMCCGIKGIFTAHGSSIEEINLNPAISELIRKNIFERLIFLDTKIKGNIDKVYTLDKDTKEYVQIIE